MAESHPGLSPQNVKLKQRFQELGATPFYEKCLTNSDTGTQGRVVIPKAVAEAQFGELLETQGAPLSGEDTDGARYDFKFRFWTNNQSRMYLIEGCADVLKKYKLAFGDVIVFARKADGTLVLGGRPQGPEDVAKRPAARARTSGKGDDKGRLPKRRKEGPQTDGTFRAVPGATGPEAQRIYPEASGWACVINIAGEPYRALFDVEADAWAAFRAACPFDEVAEAAAAGAALKDDHAAAAAAAAAAAPMQAVA